ncbi:MAG TPA: CRISPR-associated endonuclease Cas2 [Candidatus Paceibacterota bacterium]
MRESAKNKQWKRGKVIRSAQRKHILSLLFAGVALSLSAFSPRRRRLVLGELKGEFKNIDREYLHRVLRDFKYNRLVDWKESDNGVVHVVLSERGKYRALEYNLEEMRIKKPLHWDGLWRVVFFDIPEKCKRAREAFRAQLKRLGFYELQRSVYVFPYKCKNEIDFVVEFFELRQHVQYAEIIDLTSEEELKLHFNID